MISPQDSYLVLTGFKKSPASSLLFCLLHVLPDWHYWNCFCYSIKSQFRELPLRLVFLWLTTERKSPKIMDKFLLWWTTECFSASYPVIKFPGIFKKINNFLSLLTYLLFTSYLKYCQRWYCSTIRDSGSRSHCMRHSREWTQSQKAQICISDGTNTQMEVSSAGKMNRSKGCIKEKHFQCISTPSQSLRVNTHNSFSNCQNMQLAEHNFSTKIQFCINLVENKVLK